MTELALASPAPTSFVRPKAIPRMTAVHVACYFDANFDDLFFLFASSLAASRADSSVVTLHAFRQDMTEADRMRLAALPLPGIELKLHAFRHKVPRFAEYRLPSCVYHRLYIHRDLTDLDRIIYLDVDMIVQADLAPLVGLDLQGHAIAAVADYVLFSPVKQGWGIATDHFAGSFHDYLVQHGIEPSRTDEYFNSGLMVLDLASMRRSGLAEAMIREAEAHSDKYLFGDQCLINAQVGARHLELGIAWNVLFAFHHAILARRPDLAVELRDAKASAKIAHYAGPKPWTAGFEGDGVHFWAMALATRTDAVWRDRLHAAVADLDPDAAATILARAEGAIGRAKPLAEPIHTRLATLAAGRRARGLSQRLRALVAAWGHGSGNTRRRTGHADGRVGSGVASP